MQSNNVCILGSLRTPFGKFWGTLKDVPAPMLGATVISGLLKKTGISSYAIESVFMGEALTAGVGQNPARQAAIQAGLPLGCSAVTINKVCASSLATIQFATQMIQAGEAKILIAGGMENMSRSPFLLPRWENRFGNLSFKDKDDGPMSTILFDSMISDGLCDAYGDGLPHMGVLADKCATILGISRQEQEEYAYDSVKTAFFAKSAGFLDSQIVPVTTGGLKMDQDECPRNPDKTKMKNLEPAFVENGTITAATSSQLSDGASALLLASDAWSRKMGIKPLARIIASATHSQEPQWYAAAPIGAISKLLKKTGLFVNEIDLFEINEAFAVVPIYAIRTLGIQREKVNIWGGAIAFGHPLGASGARIAGNIVYQLLQNNYRYGIAVACNGGGEAVAVLIENESAH